ncbi:MAG: CoA transferase, partial [Bacteroidota bacterium]|nr:CoA transferase [Bacteroidota bacterium]
MKDLFRELTVVELASVLAGPSVGMFFAELGARVIKVESPSGDVTRGWKLPDESPDSNVSAYFSSVNYHKEYVSLDLKDPSDREHLNAILKEADVLIQNWKEGDAEKFGLSAGSLMARFPKLIIADLSGFALETQRVAYDIVLQAETGWLSMTGHPGGGPAKLPVALIDLLAGHQLKEGILAALWQRERTGTGAQVAVSLEESALASLANQASNYLMCGNIPGPMGTAHPNIAPYGEIFRCRDDHPLLLAVGSDVQFQKLC